MKRIITTLLVTASLVGATPAFAQDARPTTGSVDVTIIPAGGTFFLKGKETHEPSFGNYTAGAALTVHVNRYLSLEGEVAGALGISQTLEFSTGSRDVKSPHLLQYTGNLVVSAPNRSAVVPYVTGGVGGLTVFDTAALGIADTTHFLTGNVGGGLKWQAGRWGLRGDYRFIAVRSSDDAPDFFGKETRYGHRVYGGVFINLR